MNILKEQEDMSNPPILNYLVGCAGIIFDAHGNVLIGERVDFDGNPVFALFGGKPEYDEALVDGLAREIKEELNLDLPAERYKQIGIRESSPGKGKRCVTAFFAAVITDEEKSHIVNMEPHKCKQLIWDRTDVVVRKGLWQGSVAEVARAFSMLFGRVKQGDYNFNPRG